MCWKHEWAKAINNIEWAKIHIERAKIKVKDRNLVMAAEISEELTETLEEAQEQLKILIQDYGISKKEHPSSLARAMKGQRKKRGDITTWVKAN